MGRSAAFSWEYIDRMVPDPTTVTARFRYQFDRLRLMLGVIVRHLADDFPKANLPPPLPRFRWARGKRRPLRG